MTLSVGFHDPSLHRSLVHAGQQGTLSRSNAYNRRRVRTATAAWPTARVSTEQDVVTWRKIKCQRRTKQGIKSANQNSQTDHHMWHFNTAKYHVAERTRAVAKR